jgi:hypothetical protein
MPFIDEDIEVRACAATDWEVLKPIRYMGSREGFIVHEGFQTDFASVPRALVWLIPKYGKFTAAAILHDFLWEQCRNHKFQWSDADGIFRRAMHEDGVPFVHRWLMWGAVRLGAMKHAPADPFTNGPGEALRFVAVAVPGIAFAAIPFVLITVWLVLFWLLQLPAYGVAWLRSRRQHTRPRRPRLLWKLG